MATARKADIVLALVAGLFLALLIDFSSLMAKHSSPVYASWVAHGVGAITSLFVVFFLSKKISTNASSSTLIKPAPYWSYLGGIAGALSVVLAAITVNSVLGLASSLALMLAGQVFFGIVADLFGLFGHPKREIILADLYVVISVLTGSCMLIYFRS